MNRRWVLACALISLLALTAAMDAGDAPKKQLRQRPARLVSFLPAEPVEVKADDRPKIPRSPVSFDAVAAAPISPSEDLYELVNEQLIDESDTKKAEHLYSSNNELNPRAAKQLEVYRKGKFERRMAFDSREAHKIVTQIAAELAMRTDFMVYKSNALAKESGLFSGRKVVIDLVTVACYDGQGDLAWAASAKKYLDAHMAMRYAGGAEVRVVVFGGGQFGAGMSGTTERHKCAQYGDYPTKERALQGLNRPFVTLEEMVGKGNFRIKVDGGIPHYFVKVDDDWEEREDDEILPESQGSVVENAVNVLKYDVDDEGYMVGLDAEGAIKFGEFRSPDDAYQCMKATGTWGAWKVNDMLGRRDVFEAADVFDEVRYKNLHREGRLEMPNVMVFNFLNMNKGGDTNMKIDDMIKNAFKDIGFKQGTIIQLQVGESGYGNRHIGRKNYELTRTGRFAVGGVEHYALGIQLAEKGCTKKLNEIGNGGELGSFLEMSRFYFAYTKSQWSQVNTIDMVAGLEADKRMKEDSSTVSVLFPAARSADTSSMEACMSGFDQMKQFLTENGDKARGLTLACVSYDGTKIEECGCWSSDGSNTCDGSASGLTVNAVCSVGLPAQDFNCLLEKSERVTVVTGEGSVASAISYGKVVVYDVRTHKMDFWRSYADFSEYIARAFINPMKRLPDGHLKAAMLCAVLGDETKNDKTAGSRMTYCMDKFVNSYLDQRQVFADVADKIVEYLPLRLDFNQRLLYRIEGLLMDALWVSPDLSDGTVPMLEDINSGYDLYDILSGNANSPRRYRAAEGYLSARLSCLSGATEGNLEWRRQMIDNVAEWAASSSERPKVPSSTPIEHSSDEVSSDSGPLTEDYSQYVPKPGDEPKKSILVRRDRHPRGVRVGIADEEPSISLGDGEDPRGVSFGDEKPKVSFGDEKPKVSFGDEKPKVSFSFDADTSSDESSTAGGDDGTGSDDEGSDGFVSTGKFAQLKNTDGALLRKEEPARDDGRKVRLGKLDSSSDDESEPDEPPKGKFAGLRNVDRLPTKRAPMHVEDEPTKDDSAIADDEADAFVAMDKPWPLSGGPTTVRNS